MAVAQAKLSPTRFRGTVLATVMALVLVTVVIIAIAVATASPLFRPQAGTPSVGFPAVPITESLRQHHEREYAGDVSNTTGQLRTHFNRENGGQ
jgi:hypothetical protein